MELPKSLTPTATAAVTNGHIKPSFCVGLGIIRTAMVATLAMPKWHGRCSSRLYKLEETTL